VPEGSGDTPDIGMVLVFVDATTDIDEQIEREVAVADAVRSVDATTASRCPRSASPCCSATPTTSSARSAACSRRRS
jgi:hypothetical protein